MCHHCGKWRNTNIHYMQSTPVPKFFNEGAGLWLQQCCLIAHISSNKLAFHIWATFLPLSKIMYVIPWNVCNVTCGVPIVVTTLKIVAPGPFGGYVIKGACHRDLHRILNVIKKWCPSQLVNVSMWKTIYAFECGHPQHMYTNLARICGKQKHVLS